MENRDKRLVQFEDNFCVHLYFVQGETLRIYVEIFTCLDEGKWKKSDRVGAEMKVCGDQICPSCPHIPQPTIFSVLVCHQWWVGCHPNLSGLHYCERFVNVASIPRLGKILHLLKLWKKGCKHQWRCSRSVALASAFIYTCLKTTEA